HSQPVHGTLDLWLAAKIGAPTSSGPRLCWIREPPSFYSRRRQSTTAGRHPLASGFWSASHSRQQRQLGLPCAATPSGTTVHPRPAARRRLNLVARDRRHKRVPAGQLKFAEPQFDINAG